MAAASSTGMKTVTFKIPEEGTVEERSGAISVIPKTPHPRMLEDQTNPSSINGSGERPQSRACSDQRTGSLYTRRQYGGLRGQSSGGRLSEGVIDAVREKTNTASRQNMRSVKYSVSRLRESLLRVEEEVKHTTKGRRTLEVAVQDIRKAISVNQQSLGLQQKKTRTHSDAAMGPWRDEAKVLSKCKSEVEQYLRSVKSILHNLDNIRRALQTRISSLSQSLELDAQCFKVYRGEKEFRSRCEVPHGGSRNIDESVAAACREATEIVQRSREVRGGIEDLIVTTTTRRSQAHDSVTAAVSRSVVEANQKKREMLLERGQMRLSHNSVHHQQHNEEILLGRILGPVSDKHRSVSEKEERPLSRRRPGSSAEERKMMKQTTSKLTKRLSASAVQVTELEEAEHHLTKQLKKESLSTSLDSQTLRIRKISLDNRWVL